MSDLENSEDLQDLYESAPCGYVSIEPSGKIVKLNRTLADWLGCPADELIGRGVHDILSVGGKIAFETHLAPMLRLRGFVHEIALDLLTCGGEKIPVIANAAERRGAEGRHVFTRLTLFKAVDRRTYERSLVEARIKAEAEAKAQSETAELRDHFIAVLGHDLRNPLAAISAGLETLQRRENLSEMGLKIVANLESSASRGMELINDLLDLARGSLGGGLVIDPNDDEPLTPTIEQVVGEIRAIAPDHVIEDRLEIDEPVFCDRPRLGQLVSNLLSNAITHGSSSQPVRLSAITKDKEFVISVTNAGSPIPQEDVARLFKPFFRGVARPSRNGLGLGLFIASEVARAHQGTLDVKSNDEETSFVFRMPTGIP